MCKIILSLILFFCLSSLYATENNFYISKTYFPGEKVTRFSENRGGAVAVLANGRIFLMNKQMEFAEITESFDQEVRNDISCIESINETTFLLGTNSHSLFLYEDGTVLALKEVNPELPLRINSIDFSAYYYDSQVMIATSDNIYISNDFRTYTSAPFSYTTDVVFYGSRNVALLTDYTRCTTIPGDLGLQVRGVTGTILYRIFENDTLFFNQLNDVAFHKAGYGSGFYNTYALYGTDNGIYAQHISDCGPQVVRHFSGVEVHDFALVGSGLLDNTLFVATDSGLLTYYHESVYDPIYYDSFDEVDTAFQVTYSRFHNNIWVATNNGLKVISEDHLTRESFEPGENEFDTIAYCQTDGAYLRVDLNDQLDIQWFKNDERIEGAISTHLHTFEPGHYFVEYGEYGEKEKLDVAFVRHDSIFTEYLVVSDSIICPDEFSAGLRIEHHDIYQHYNDEHYIRWYSVERGLEQDVGYDYNSLGPREAGHYFFTSTNCNGYVYTSDTVEVVKSNLQEPAFDSYNAETDLCAGDTIFLADIDHAVDFKWYADYSFVEDYNKPYFVVSREFSEDYVSATAIDEYGCEQEARVRLKQVLDPPYLSPDQLTRYICDTTGYVYLSLPYGSYAVWEGEVDGIPEKVGPGVYPITVSNDVCEDFHSELNIIYYDPYPFADTVVTLLIGDTLKIPAAMGFPTNYGSEWQYHWIHDYMFITSNLPKEIQTYLGYANEYCYKIYNITIRFVTEMLLANEVVPSLKIYPNPVEEIVYIDGYEQDNVLVELLDLSGKTLITMHVEKGSNLLMLRLPDVQKGIYLIRLTQKDGNQLIKKIMVE